MRCTSSGLSRVKPWELDAAVVSMPWELDAAVKNPIIDAADGGCFAAADGVVDAVDVGFGVGFVAFF